jgi:hypothetical protein
MHVLRIANKATKVRRNSPSDAWFWDTRTSHSYYVSIVIDTNWDLVLDLDEFSQGERFGKLSTVLHHKVDGHIEHNDVKPSADGWDAYYEFVDKDWPSGWRRTRISMTTDWIIGKTAYLGVAEIQKLDDNGTPIGEPVYERSGHAFRYDPSYYDRGVIYYRPKITGTGFNVFVESWDSIQDYYRYNDTSIDEVGVDLDAEKIEQYKIYFKNYCAGLVSADRQDAEAIHDTLIRDAVDDISTFDEVNNIANAKMIFDTLKSLVTGEWSSLISDLAKEKSTAKVAADLWLKYRYAYTTTKSDINAEIERAKRALPKDSTIIGRAGQTIGKTEYHATCIAQNPLYQEYLNHIYDQMARLGVAPTWQNVWDLVPFSFIVDWFVPLADFSEQERLNQYINGSSSDVVMRFSGYCYSAKTVLYDDYRHNEWSGRLSLSYYDRVAGIYPTVSSEIAWYRKPKSAKTWSKRVLDGISLIIGMRK